MWLHQGCGLDVTTGQRAGAKFDSSLHSRLLLPGLVVRRVDSDRCLATLGHGSWAALAWPLQGLGQDEVDAEHVE